jgi:hypothetical protein
MTGNNARNGLCPACTVRAFILDFPLDRAGASTTFMSRDPATGAGDTALGSAYTVPENVTLHHSTWPSLAWRSENLPAITSVPAQMLARTSTAASEVCSHLNETVPAGVAHIRAENVGDDKVQEEHIVEDDYYEELLAGMLEQDVEDQWGECGTYGNAY